MRRATYGKVRRTVLLLAVLAAVATTFLAAGGPASAAKGDASHPPRAEECKVPQTLWVVAAEVDPDSLEGCGYFEDPNYHENRKEAGTYNPNGPFSRIFG